MCVALFQQGGVEKAADSLTFLSYNKVLGVALCYKSSPAVLSQTTAAVMKSSYFWFCQTFAAVLWFELPPPIFPLWGGIQGSHFSESQKLLFPQSVVPSKAGSKQGRSKWKATAKSVASITWWVHQMRNGDVFSQHFARFNPSTTLNQ